MLVWVAIALAGSPTPGKKAEWWYQADKVTTDGISVEPVDPVAREAWIKVGLRFGSPSAKWVAYDLSGVQARFGETTHAPRAFDRDKWLVVPAGGNERVTALFEGSPPGPFGYLVEDWRVDLGPAVRFTSDGVPLPFDTLPLSGEAVTVDTATCQVLSVSNGKTRDYLGTSDVLIVTSTTEATLDLVCTNHGEDWLMLRPLGARLGGPAGDAPRGGPLAALPPGRTVVVPILFPKPAPREGQLAIQKVVVRPEQQHIPPQTIVLKKDAARSKN